jgi:hypothetical protein
MAVMKAEASDVPLPAPCARPFVATAGSTCVARRAVVQAGIEASSARQFPSLLRRTPAWDGCSTALPTKIVSGHSPSPCSENSTLARGASLFRPWRGASSKRRPGYLPHPITLHRAVFGTCSLGGHPEPQSSLNALLKSFSSTAALVLTNPPWTRSDHASPTMRIGQRIR